MKKTGKILCGVLLSCVLLFGCAKPDGTDGAESEPDVQSEPYDTEHLGDYLEALTYRGMQIPLSEANESHGEAVWRYLTEQATVTEYPSRQLSYYEAQLRAQYRYLAEREQMSYEELLSLRGMTEDSLTEEAKRLVKSDLVYWYVVTDAGISLSEEEKTTLYDRYADRYAQEYGYDRSYLDTHMKDLIFDAMLYDKTTEFLVLNNSVFNPYESASS